MSPIRSPASSAARPGAAVGHAADPRVSLASPGFGRAQPGLHPGYALLLAFALALPAAAAQPTDYIRESRWSQEVLAGLVVGDPVWLATPARPRILALLTEPSTPSKGGVILVHGLGVHPDFGMIGGVRTGLADAGFTTLSVQMPVLAADAPRDDYRATLPEAGDRIAAAIAWLRARGVTRIAIVSHSYGATMVDAWLARPDAARIEAWAPVGMLIDFSAAPKQPVLDAVAEREFKEVDAAAPLRKARLPKDGCSRDLTIAGADHYFDRRQEALTAAIVAFLDRVFAGRCT